MHQPYHSFGDDIDIRLNTNSNANLNANARLHHLRLGSHDHAMMHIRVWPVKHEQVLMDSWCMYTLVFAFPLMELGGLVWELLRKPCAHSLMSYEWYWWSMDITLVIWVPLVWVYAASSDLSKALWFIKPQCCTSIYHFNDLLVFMPYNVL